MVAKGIVVEMIINLAVNEALSKPIGTKFKLENLIDDELWKSLNFHIELGQSFGKKAQNTRHIKALLNSGTAMYERI